MAIRTVNGAASHRPDAGARTVRSRTSEIRNMHTAALLIIVVRLFRVLTFPAPAEEGSRKPSLLATAARPRSRCYRYATVPTSLLPAEPRRTTGRKLKVVLHTKSRHTLTECEQARAEEVERARPNVSSIS